MTGDAASLGLILIRTHFVDDRLAETARRYAASDDYDVMFAVDETLGPVDCRGLAKLSLSLDSCARLGLLVSLDKPLWRCGDYVFYHALELAPRYRYVWSIEYDVVINFADPLDFFRSLDARAAEGVLCADLHIAAPDWWWRKMAARRFGDVYMALFPLVRMTPAAIAAFYDYRRHDSRRVGALDLPHGDHWLNDESFVASYARQNGIPIADFNAYGDYYTPETYAQKLLLHVDDVPPPDNRIYHAARYGLPYLLGCRSYYKADIVRLLALGDADFPAATLTDVLTEMLAARLGKLGDDPSALFGAGGALAEIAPHFARPAVASALMRALGRARMRVTLEAIQTGRLRLDLVSTPEHDNVALGRDAWQSSVSGRARGRDTRHDAEHGNNGDRSVEYGFHTAYEEGPWWAVDLGRLYPIRLIRIFNRKFAEPKLRRFIVEVSNDFEQWRTLFAHELSARELLFAEPIDIALGTPEPARYVRIRLPRKGVLHLVEVEVYKAAPTQTGNVAMAEWPQEKPTIRSYSQYGEDALMFHFLYLHSRIANGTYVDIGAFDPVQYSNTFLLHKHGWRGVNIDIVAERIEKFRAARPNDVNILAAVGDHDGEIEVYEHPKWASMTTVDAQTAEYHHSRPVGKIACRTLRGLLEEHGINHIDYVNIDVEGFEMQVLSTFDPAKYGVSLFTIELLTQDINDVLGSEVFKYMTRHGYVFCGWTGWTLFFRSPGLAV